MEENRIIQNATNKNRLSRANTNDTKQMITAEGNLQDVFEMINAMRKGVSRSFTALCSLSCAPRRCRSLSVCNLR